MRMSRFVTLSVVGLFLAGCGPVGPIPGGRLYGEVVTEPVSDWRFTDPVMTIAVETRPSFPHSVNTFCFTHGAKLYIPAANPSAKKWPEFVRQNPSVRLRIAGKIYSGRVRRVTDAGDIRELLGSLAAKYPAVAAASQGEGLPDYAIYRFDDQATAP